MHFREYIRLVEMVDLSKTAFERATRDLYHELYNNSGGDLETIYLTLHLDLDVKMNSRLFQRTLKNWCFDEIQDAFYRICHLFRGTKIKIYRVITAPVDWQPDPNRHPGVYWSWDEHASEAHWGEFHGQVKWQLIAEVDFKNIDWNTTLVLNADPSYSDEREIRVKKGVPIKFVSTT